MSNFAYHFPTMRIGKFLLKKGETIPLHIHPSQYAMAYLLSGKAEISVYNILEQKQDEYSLFLDSVSLIETGDYQILTPTKNGHRIKALEDSWFLDTFSPGKEEGPLSVYLEVIAKQGDAIRARALPFDAASLPPSLRENHACEQRIS